MVTIEKANCHHSSRPKVIIRGYQAVSGIGDDHVDWVLVSEECKLAASCSYRNNGCPLGDDTE